MRQLLLVSYYWLIFSSASFAQPAYDTVALTKSANPFYLKLNPFALLEFDGGIGISGEYVWTKRKLGFQLEVQPVLFSYDGVLEDADGTAGFESPENTIESAMPVGFKLRPEIRYYFNARKGLFKEIKETMKDIIPWRKSRTPIQTYVAIDFLYKYTQRERLGDLLVSNGGVGTSYRQRTTYTDVKKVLGFDLKAGAISPIGKSNRWLIEAYIGLGYRHKTYSYKNLPPGVSAPARNLFLVARSPTDNRENLGLKVNGVSLPATFKLVCRL